MHHIIALRTIIVHSQGLDSQLGNNHAMVHRNSVVFTHNGLWLSLGENPILLFHTVSSAWDGLP